MVTPHKADEGMSASASGTRGGRGLGSKKESGEGGGAVCCLLTRKGGTGHAIVKGK